MPRPKAKPQDVTPPPAKPAAAARPVARVAPGSPAPADPDAFPCSVYDLQSGRPCGQPCEADTLTCPKHRVRATRTQISRADAARRRSPR